MARMASNLNEASVTGSTWQEEHLKAGKRRSAGRVLTLEAPNEERCGAGKHRVDGRTTNSEVAPNGQVLTE